ncbi:MAG TPA: SDR family NAD(P)-dependent oxidoreductase [Acidimicrobiales bacterium]|nr:SDR family NAD(P)-dependent oxidoreductase [Acidimicrobiales bacterium]
MDVLTDRTGVVIGGGGGIGRGVSLGLAYAGMNVVVADIELDSATRVADEITRAGGRSIARRVDATSADSLDSLAETTIVEFGAVHVLSNNVGVILNRRLDEATEAEWSWFVEFNVMSIVRGNLAFLPHLRAHRQGGHIVNTSSMAGLLALEPRAVGGYFNGLYTTTKHALIGYCEMLRMELAPERIGVSVLCPGLVAGNLSSTAARNRPERFGGPLADPRAGAPPNPAAMPNDAVGPIVVDAIRANRFYVFTHPDSVALVRARHQHVLDDFEFYRTRSYPMTAPPLGDSD